MDNNCNFSGVKSLILFQTNIKKAEFILETLSGTIMDEFSITPYLIIILLIS